MKKLALIIFMGLFFLISITTLSLARPPRPGPNYVWVPPHVNVHGVFIKGHWKYIGPQKHGWVWVPGHFNRFGKWVPGHWKKI